MTLQNPSTVQTIHFTQLTLLYRQLLSEIETGYYWTVWKIQLCGTIKLLEVCYSTSQWTWHVVSSSGLRSDLWTQSLEISLSEIFLWIFAISIHWKDQTNYTGKTHCETLHITDTLWLLSLVRGRRNSDSTEVTLLKNLWMGISRKYNGHHKWVNSEVQAFCQHPYPHLALSPIQWQSRLLLCLILPDYLAAATHSLFNAWGIQFGTALHAWLMLF